MLIIPAFLFCPSLEIDASDAELRLLALALSHAHKKNDVGPICMYVGAFVHVARQDNKHLDSVDADFAFYNAVRQALAPYAYLPNFLVENYPIAFCSYAEAAALRPQWAEHISRSIYEQIGA